MISFNETLFNFYIDLVAKGFKAIQILVIKEELVPFKYLFDLGIVRKKPALKGTNVFVL